MSESETENVSRRERRARSKGGATEEIKDRNQRLRADAVSRRRKERKRELASAAREGLDAGERMDDALTRGADATGRFMRNHFRWLQWIVVLGVVGSMAFLVYDYRQGLQREKNGTKLGAALAATFGRLGSDDPATPADRNLVDTREEFASEEDRAKAATEAWTKLGASKKPELSFMAKLGKASVLYDERKYDQARKAYEAAFADPTGARFPSLKARAQEGIGLCYEAEGLLDDALKAFLTLKDMGKESKELGTFHEGRVKYSQGKTDEAKKLLEELLQKLTERRGAAAPPSYLEAATEDLLKTIDPTRASQAPGMSPEQLEALKRQLEQLQRGQAGGDVPPGIPSPAMPVEMPGPAEGPSPNEGTADADASEPKTPEGSPAQTEGTPTAPAPAPKTTPAPTGEGSSPE